MTCKLCMRNKKLVRSHIIPKAMYRDVYPNGEGLQVSKDECPKRLRIGVYD